MKQFTLLCFYLFVSFIAVSFLFPHKIFAARSITIASDTSALHGYDEMTITIASMSGFTNGETIYVKGAFYKDGSTNYFGYSKNGDAWVKNGDSLVNQRRITIGDWDGKLVVQSDFSDSGYVNYGEGDYKLKIGFYYYTSGGNVSSVNWSTNSLDVAISDPDPTPTPTMPPTNTPIPTSTPKPTTFPTISPTIRILPTMSLLTYPTASESSGSSEILGSSISANPTLIAGIEEKKNYTTSVLGRVFLAGGILILASCGILFYYLWKKGKLHEETSG